MDPVSLLGLSALLGLFLCQRFLRRRELLQMSVALAESARAEANGDRETRLAFPLIDLSKCMGCGTCVEVCPESGVLDLVHGQAAVVRGSACRGIAACEAECPVGAVQVTVANRETRTDIPWLEDLSVPGQPGLFLAGEVTGEGSIRVAFDQGIKAGGQIAKELEERRVGSMARMAVQSSRHATSHRAGAESMVEDSFGGARLTESTNPSGQAAANDGVEGVLDLLIVGAGPAGLACALVAKDAGLTFALVDQAQSPGGAITNFPRRKLVLTSPVVLPLAGKLRARSYRKEELLTLWQELISRHELPFVGGKRLASVNGDGPRAALPGETEIPHGVFSIGLDSVESEGDASGGRQVLRASKVCLALGRAGSPRKLGVPGEEQTKVAYALDDSSSLSGLHIAVVGGGLSAVEAALELSAPGRPGPSNVVTLVHRRSGFTRLSGEQERELLDARDAGRIELALNSRVTVIGSDSVELEAVADGSAKSAEGGAQNRADSKAPPQVEAARIPNDVVLILIGGVPSFGLLEGAGVEFESADSPAAEPVREEPERRSLFGKLLIAMAFGLPLATLVQFRDYYALAGAARPEHGLHDLLRPGAGLGLVAGLISVVLILANLAYLPRRSAPPNLRIGSLAGWMRVHVVTGILVPVLVFLHAAAAPRETVGGHGFWTLVALVITGTIGRYLYSVLPRAANGAELAQAEVKRRLATASTTMGSAMGPIADEALTLVQKRQWGTSFLGRLKGMFGARRDLKEFEQRVRQGWSRDAKEQSLDEVLALTRVAWRRALLLAHLEDLRALGSSWRYFHRWVAILMVVLVVLHIAHASAFGGVLDELGRLFDFGVRIK